MMPFIWLPVLLNMLASESRMVVHVAVGTIDPWIFVNPTIKVE